MPYLEARGRISLAALDKTLKPIEPVKGESLTAYYLRLCELDVKISMPWIAQVFAGLSLGELRLAVKEMIRSGGAIEPPPPKIYPAQAQLIRTLMTHGIEVVPGQCPLMFLPNPTRTHRAHAWVKKAAGTYPV